ncbi:hypothetical protein BY458DRAFT_525412 [Sporodiniella umbellata]|nr:hypothetical protein BY458DRAFT_525412 [Sporodiniella umbellata]
MDNSRKIVLPPIRYFDPLDPQPSTHLPPLPDIESQPASPTTRPLKRRSFHAFESTHEVPKRHSLPEERKKPRWSMEDRVQLIQAIIQDKQLDDMTTFDWNTIATGVQRNHKACKDQWRREILPLLQKLPYMNQFHSE